MKRAREMLPGNDYEIRNNKVQKKLGVDAWLIKALAQTDVYKQIIWCHKRLRWQDAWFSGNLQIFKSHFENGDEYIPSVWHNVEMRSDLTLVGGSVGMFNAWWGFLDKVKGCKIASGHWDKLTIQSSHYYSVLRKDFHKWESFHLGGNTNMINFELTEGSLSESEDDLNLTLIQ